MNYKLYSNMKRITTWFAVGIIIATFSVLTLRLTVFSDMVDSPQNEVSDVDPTQGGGYKIKLDIYFSVIKS